MQSEPLRLMQYPDERLIFFDIESGGFFNVAAGRVNITKPLIQVAAMAVDAEFEELESFEVKIAFDERHADKAALTRNRYDRELWEREAVAAGNAARKFAAFLRRHATVSKKSGTKRPFMLAQLVAHNAERFDGPLIHAWYESLRQFCPAAYSVFCTKQRAYWLFCENKSLTPPPDYELRTLCHYFGVSLKSCEAHNAINDVRALVEVYREMAKFAQSATTLKASA